MSTTTMPSDAAAARTREAERQKLRDAAKHLGVDKLRDGTWFRKTVAAHVKKHCETVPTSHWDHIYAGVDVEERADREIQKVARRASAAGAMAAIGASTGELLSLFTEGLAAPVGVPAAGLSMALEAGYTALLQIDLTCDLASIYGVPFDGDDVGEVATLFGLALDVDVKENKKKHAGAEPPPEGQGLTERLIELEEGEIATRIGRKLLEESVMRNIIPLVNFPISARWNYVATRKLGTHVKRYMRYRRALTSACKKLRFDKVTHPAILVEGAWLLATCDGEAGHEEVMAIAHIMDLLEPAQREALELDKTLGDDEEQWFDELTKIAPDMVAPLLDTLFIVAATDKELIASERRFLRRVGRALSCEIDFDRLARIVAHLSEGEDPPEELCRTALQAIAAANGPGTAAE